MQQNNIIQNPFSIVQYNCSWSALKDQIQEILHHTPNRYKMAYHNEDEQKIILFTSLDFNVFGKERITVIYISKIDSCTSQSILAFEAKNYTGDITTKEDFERGQYHIDILAEDMMQLYC